MPTKLDMEDAARLQNHGRMEAMSTRRVFLRTSAVAAAYLASGTWLARAANAPGVTDTEIKIGQTARIRRERCGR
jgi:hypothetical protein